MKCETKFKIRAPFYARAIAGAVALLLFPPAAAWCDSVVTNCSEVDLRTAMAAGGVVTFGCNGTIILTSTIDNTVDTTLDGSGHEIIISGGNAVRLFRVETNVSFTMIGLTLADGFSPAGSGVLNRRGLIHLTGVTMRGNVASIAAGVDGLVIPGAGGAIWSEDGIVSATNCTFSGNTAVNQSPGEAHGGAIFNENGSLLLDRCTFMGNQALGAQAVTVFPQYTGTTVAGGAIHNRGELVADYCSWIENMADAGDGYSPYGSPGGAALGGAIYNSGNAVISRSTLAGNIAAGGHGGQGYTGGVMHDFGLQGGFGGGGGYGDGGALLNRNSATLVNCTIASNTGIGGDGGPGGVGGSGFNWGGGGGFGGVGGNGFGGVDGTCDLTNCTLALNIGGAGSGGQGGPGGTGSLGNGGTGFPGQGGSAWGATLCGGLVNTLLAANLPGGNDSFPEPKIGPLANNGGPTLTMALLPGSPAIDAGDSSLAPATDQRGQPRPAGRAADLGAYEFDFNCPPPAILCPADSTNTFATPQAARVEFAIEAVSACDPAPVITCLPASGTVFPVGPTTVTCQVIDAAGRSNSCSFIVTVRLSNQCPEAKIGFTAFCAASNATSAMLMANEQGKAGIVFDGSQSTDADGDALVFHWFADGSILPFSQAATNTHWFVAGEHDITLVVDDGQCLGQAAVRIEVITAQELVEGLIQDIDNSSLPRGKKRALIGGLNKICNRLEKDKKDNFKFALARLQHFQKELRVGLKKYPAEQEQFNATAQTIIDALNCAGEIR